MPGGAALNTLHLRGGLASSDSCVEQQAPTMIGAPPAQLTIFYSGVVNVYNDVPADKAHALMLLLDTNGNGNGNDDGRSLSGPVQESRRPPGTADMAARVSSSILRGARRPPGTADMAARVSSSILRGARLMQQPIKTTPPRPSPSTSTQAPQNKQQILVKRSQAELPFARKASLARFLEKRKDRVQGKPGSNSSEEDCPSKKIKLSTTEPLQLQAGLLPLTPQRLP